MHKRLLAGILLTAVFSSASAAPWPLEIIDHLDETKIIIYVKESDIEQAPVWSPAEGAPSFGLKELLQSIADWDNEVPGLTGARIEKIELKPILHQEKKGRWYYLVQLVNQQEGRPKHHYLAVLMNGKAVAAIEEPASYK